jgi:hypothetical protein
MKPYDSIALICENFYCENSSATLHQTLHSYQTYLTKQFNLHYNKYINNFIIKKAWLDSCDDSTYNEYINIRHVVLSLNNEFQNFSLKFPTLISDIGVNVHNDEISISDITNRIHSLFNNQQYDYVIVLAYSTYNMMIKMTYSPNNQDNTYDDILSMLLLYIGESYRAKGLIESATYATALGLVAYPLHSQTEPLHRLRIALSIPPLSDSVVEIERERVQMLNDLEVLRSEFARIPIYSKTSIEVSES